MARSDDVLADVMVTRGILDHVRSDNGPEFIALRLRQWLADVGAQTLYIEPGSPWENSYCESFNSKLRDEFLNGEIFYSLKEAQILTERWRVHYNVPHPVLWTQVNATPPGVARAPRGPRSACDTRASRAAKSCCTAPRTRSLRRVPP